MSSSVDYVHLLNTARTAAEENCDLSNWHVASPPPPLPPNASVFDRIRHGSLLTEYRRAQEVVRDRAQTDAMQGASLEEAIRAKRDKAAQAAAELQRYGALHSHAASKMSTLLAMSPALRDVVIALDLLDASRTASAGSSAASPAKPGRKRRRSRRGRRPSYQPADARSELAGPPADVSIGAPCRSIVLHWEAVAPAQPHAVQASHDRDSAHAPGPCLCASSMPSTWWMLVPDKCEPAWAAAALQKWGASSPRQGDVVIHESISRDHHTITVRRYIQPLLLGVWPAEPEHAAHARKAVVQLLQAERENERLHGHCVRGFWAALARAYTVWDARVQDAVFSGQDMAELRLPDVPELEARHEGSVPEHVLAAATHAGVPCWPHSARGWSYITQRDVAPQDQARFGQAKSLLLQWLTLALRAYEVAAANVSPDDGPPLMFRGWGMLGEASLARLGLTDQHKDELSDDDSVAG